MSPPPIAKDRGGPSESSGLIGILFESFGGMLRLPRFDWRGRLLVFGLVVVAWASTAIYRVQPDEQGVVMRFGARIYTARAGLGVHWPYPIDTVQFSKAPKVDAIERQDSPAVAAASGRARRTESSL